VVEPALPHPLRAAVTTASRSRSYSGVCTAKQRLAETGLIQVDDKSCQLNRSMQHHLI
jgi:hypothetical protein